MKQHVLLLPFVVFSVLSLVACAQQQSSASVPLITESTPSSSQSVENPIMVQSGTESVPSSIDLRQITPIPPSIPLTIQSDQGPITVTLDNQGGTIALSLGETFLLQLGDTYTWDIAISDQTVISRVKNIAVIKGAQGVYESLKMGTVTLTATGDPLCRQSQPPCGQPSIQFQLTIVVK